MTGETAWSQYQTRLLRVADYIHNHLDEELDMERLAEIACMSPYHWHRIYRAIYNETLASTVKRLRLHRAAADIVRTDMPVGEIAKRSGYPNAQSFNRIFKATFGMPPARYRRQGSHIVFDMAASEEFSDMFDVKVISIAPLELAGVAHKGAYLDIGKAFETLIGTVLTRGVAKPGFRLIGVYLDDPDIVPAAELRSFACTVIEPVTVVTAPLELRKLDGGDYAVLRHKGPYADMHKAYRWLYGQWLPSSGRALRDAPMFEDYINNPREVPPTELLSDIYMPLQPR